MICATASAQQYVFHVYRQAEGLGNLSVTDMVTDGKGFFWVATENGLYRFLGSNFERFGAEQGIKEIYVRSLAVGADGTVWRPLVRTSTGGMAMAFNG